MSRQAYAKYTATAKHASPQWQKDLEGLTISVFYDGRIKAFSCDASTLGCSRDYQVSEPADAVIKFLSEHGYYMIRPKRMEG